MPNTPREHFMKQAPIAFKTTPEVKRVLEELAKQGFRSLSGQVEMIVVQYLQDHGLILQKEKKPKK